MARARKTLGPVETWASIVEDPVKAKGYKSIRGRGGFVRVAWDEATEIIAAANIRRFDVKVRMEPGDQASRSNCDVADEKSYPCEWRCIGFLCARDGASGARDHCERTNRTYRSAVLMSRKRGYAHHFASLPEYRRQFIASYLDFKRFSLGRSSSLPHGE